MPSATTAIGTLPKRMRRGHTGLGPIAVDVSAAGQPALSRGRHLTHVTPLRELGELFAHEEGWVVGLIARAGHPVWMVELSAFKASRPRWGSACGKSDLEDAFMLADYARTDGHRLRPTGPVERASRELAALVRARTALVEARTSASNQLWAIQSSAIVSMRQDNAASGRSAAPRMATRPTNSRRCRAPPRSTASSTAATNLCGQYS